MLHKFLTIINESGVFLENSQSIFQVKSCTLKVGDRYFDEYKKSFLFYNQTGE